MPGPSRSLLAFRQLDWAPDSDFPELVAEAINPLRRSLARESALRLSDGLFTPFLRHRRGSGPPIIRAVPLAAAGAGEQSLDHGETILALKDAGRDRCDAGACAGSRSGRAPAAETGRSATREFPREGSLESAPEVGRLPARYRPPRL